MTQRIAIAAILFLTTFACTGRAQQQTADPGCDAPAGDDALTVNADASPRMHATMVKDAEGKSHYVLSPVKELKVARLIFVGQPALPPSLQEEIAKSLSPQDRNDDEEALEALEERIRDAWQHQGYFKAEVKLSGTQVLSEDDESKSVAITMNVAAGKLYRLDAMNFAIAIFNPEHRSASALALAQDQRKFSAEEMRALFPIQQGEVFDTHKIQAGMEKLRKAYAAKGFINMSAVPTFELDEKNNRIIMNLEIDEGEQYRIGNVDVVGYDPPEVHPLMRNFGIVPGAIFNGSQLDGLIKQIHAMLPDQFDSDQIDSEDAVQRRLNDNSGTVDLIFKIYVCPQRFNR